MNRSSARRTIFSTLVTLLVLWAIVFGLFFSRNTIYDWWRLRSYTPPAEVVQLADDTAMTDGARKLFYVYRPSVESNDTFNQHCRDSEYTIVLGCYIQYQGIYLFKVDDARLQGVEEVTAAHEVLHAAYDRLSSSERTRIDTLTSRYFSTLTDQRIVSTVKQYQDNDPASVPSELHSILATEVRDLPDELEEHYAQYFKDRSVIVGYSEQYEKAFSGRKAQIEQLERDLESLKNQVEAANQRLEQDQATLKAISNSFDARQGVMSQAEVDSYNREVEQYNAEVRKTARLIDTYNAKYETYKNIVGEQNELYSKIDSRPSTVQSQ